MRLTQVAVSWIVAVSLLGSPAFAETQAPPSGKCASPRDSVYTLLFWLQDGDQYHPAKAALCIDKTGLEKASVRGPKLAEQFKKVLDGKGLYVNLEDIPEDPAHKDAGGNHRFDLFPDVLTGITYEKAPDGHWMLTGDSRDKIPALYRATFPWQLDDMVASFPNWMKTPLIGIQLWQLLGVLLLLFVALVLNKAVTFTIRTYVKRLVVRMDSEWLNQAVTSSDKPIGGLVVAAVVVAFFPVLQFPVRMNQLANLGAKVLAAFSSVWLAYRLIDVLTDFLASKAELTDTKLDDQLVPLTRKSLKLFVAIVGGIFVMQNLNVNVGSLLAGLGLGGLAFALAAKDTVANFFGSVMIFIDKPFQIGDWIKIGSIEGTVEEVGFRTTRVRTFYDSIITVPNAGVTNTSIENMGARRYRRYKTVLGLSYSSRAEQIQAFCEGVRAIILAAESTRNDSFRVEFAEFGGSSLDISLTTYILADSTNEEYRARSNINMEILRLAERLGVEFAFPTRTIHIESQAQPGAIAEPASADPKELAEVVKGFGPDGKLGHPHGYQITGGFRPIEEEA